MEHAPALVGTVKLARNAADWPGARLSGPKTGVFAAGRSATTVTFVSVILPVLATQPCNAISPPGATGKAGQVPLIVTNGVVVIGQVVVVLSATGVPQRSTAVADSVSVTEQSSNGTV